MSCSKHEPWLDQVCDREYHAQNDAGTSDNNVGDSQERILAAHDGSRGDEYRLRTAVDRHREDYTH